MNEYISREDVLKKAKSSILVPTDNEWDCGYNTAMAEMQGFIKQLPAADVQPVDYAEWVCHEPEIGLYYSCSRCGHNALQGMYKFCPNCGARMKGAINND